MKDLPADLIMQDDAIQQIVNILKPAKPFNDFLRRAIID